MAKGERAGECGISEVCKVMCVYSGDATSASEDRAFFFLSCKSRASVLSSTVI